MKKFIIILFILLSFLLGDEIEDIYGKKAIGDYLGIKNRKIVFLISGTENERYINPASVARITITETGEVLDREKIEKLTGIADTDTEAGKTEDTLPESSQEKISISYNPCMDEVYLKIKQIDLNEMSDREYQYFLYKDKECTDFTKRQYFQLDYQSNTHKTGNGTNQNNQKNIDNTDYYLKGASMAESEFKSAAGLGGLVSGFGGGLIGWGIGSAIISTMDVNIPYRHLQGLNSREQKEFKNGYEDSAKKIRKKDFNMGAGVGTVAIVILVLTSGN